MANKTLPKILYVYRDGDPEEEGAVWYVADEEIENCANSKNNTLVGKYELKELTNVRYVVTTELVKNKVG